MDGRSGGVRVPGSSWLKRNGLERVRPVAAAGSRFAEALITRGEEGKNSVEVGAGDRDRFRSVRRGVDAIGDAILDVDEAVVRVLQPGEGGVEDASLEDGAVLGGEAVEEFTKHSEGLRENTWVAQARQEVKPLEASAAVEEPGNDRRGKRRLGSAGSAGARDVVVDAPGADGRGAAKPKRGQLASRRRRRKRRAWPIPGRRPWDEGPRRSGDCRGAKRGPWPIGGSRSGGCWGEGGPRREPRCQTRHRVDEGEACGRRLSKRNRRDVFVVVDVVSKPVLMEIDATGKDGKELADFLVTTGAVEINLIANEA